ncbi:MAG: trypsin-like peptidase domain-containing protein [Patescibacteria group bacterium]|nr:trypsin-like peptidase domain-containing protein [Patescibacteria group bacterium]
MFRFKKVFFIFALTLIALLSSCSFAVPKAKGAINRAPTNYNYDLISQSAYPSTLEPGATTNVWIEVKNTGNQIWQKNGTTAVRLGSGSAYGNRNQKRDYDSEFAGSDWLSANRPSAISNDTVAPGETTRFQFNIKVPNNPGNYKAYFTPVVDGVAWMKDIGLYWQITVKGNGANPIDKNLSQTGTVNSTATIYQTSDLINDFAPAVVKIVCKASSRYWSQGSGTLFHNSDGDPNLPEYYIITNLHVVQTDDGSVSNCDIKIFPDYKNSDRYLTFTSQGYKDYGDNLDFAILEPKVHPATGGVNSSKASAGTFADLARYAEEDSRIAGGDLTQENIGERMIVFGYPENGGLFVSEGNIVGYETYQSSEYLDTSALLRHGNSGGLAVNSYGQILGIPTFVKGNIGMVLDMDYLASKVF